MKLRAADYLTLLVALCQLAPVGAVAQPTTGLAASYPFSGNANDATGTAHGTVFGAALTSDRFGTPNAAYVFDGTDDYIEAPASSLPTAERTVAIWFRATTVASRPCLMGYGGGTAGPPGESWFMCLNAKGSASYQVQSHWDTNEINYFYPGEPVGQWRHFAATTAATGTRLFVDCEERAADTNFIANTVTAGTDLAIGVIVSEVGAAPYADVSVGYFSGELDDLFIYNRALAPAEIAEFCPPPPDSADVPIPPFAIGVLGALIACVAWASQRRSSRAS
jgi:hypothetical protein